MNNAGKFLSLLLHKKVNLYFGSGFPDYCDHYEISATWFVINVFTSKTWELEVDKNNGRRKCTSTRC